MVCPAAFVVLVELAPVSVVVAGAELLVTVTVVTVVTVAVELPHPASATTVNPRRTLLMSRAIVARNNRAAAENGLESAPRTARPPFSLGS
jgi:hypothetical protein